jgi:hypothetical protein
MRLVCLLLNLTGLDRFVAASYGAQPQVNVEVARAIVAYPPTETPRLAKAMARKVITMTQAETCTGGLGLVASTPVSHGIRLAHLAQSREQATWHARMAPARAQRHCEGMQSTSDAAPGLVADGAHQLGAQHSPALFHVQHERSQAVCAPLATKERAANQALSDAQEELDQARARLASIADQLEKRGPGRPPKAPMRLAHAQPTLDAARREHARLAQPRQQVTQRLEASGPAYHCVDLDRGGRRNGPRIAADIRAHIALIRTLAQHEHLGQRSLARIDTAERVGPTMHAPLECVAGYVRQPGKRLDLPPPISVAMHATRIPSYALARVAHTCPVEGAEPLRQLARRLRIPLLEPGGALRELSPQTQRDLRHQANERAEVCQRLSANVAGRNGSLALRNPPLRGLDRPRKRAGLPTMHNVFLTRPDGTTAAARFFGQKPRSMFAAIWDAVELPPAPRSPQRRV